MKTLLKSDIVNLIKQKDVDLPVIKIVEVLNALVDITKEELIKGNKIRIRNFGTFEKRTYGARKRCDPYTHELKMYPAVNRIHFKQSPGFKKLLNGGD